LKPLFLCGVGQFIDSQENNVGGSWAALYSRG
jgi:hypothetical protein